jgi:hypothetical protein
MIKTVALAYTAFFGILTLLLVWASISPYIIPTEKSMYNLTAALSFYFSIVAAILIIPCAILTFLSYLLKEYNKLSWLIVTPILVLIEIPLLSSGIQSLFYTFLALANAYGLYNLYIYQNKFFPKNNKPKA